MSAFVDFVINGRGHGEVGQMMEGMRWDPGMLRPYFETNPLSPYRGRPVVTISTGRMIYNNAKGTYHAEKKVVLIRDLQERGVNSPVFNATSLRKEEFIEMDKQVIRATRYRLRAAGDLEASNSYSVNGMAKTVLETEAMSDPGIAVVDMEGTTEGRNDSPLFNGQGLPLPITHSDFNFSQRRLMTSRGSPGTALDSVMIEAAGRRVAESIEKTTIGTVTGLTYGGQNTALTYLNTPPQVYGYTNFPQRITKTNLTVPTGSNPEATIADVLAMRNTMYDHKFYGPYMIYHSTDWDTYLDNDYARLGGNNASMTLRDRLRKIEGVQDVRRLDFLFGSAPVTNPALSTYLGPGGEVEVSLKVFTLLMVEMDNPNVARMVTGLPITVVQWETMGGMRLNFKVMCIKVPQLRCDYYGNCGILHATTT